MAAYNYNVAKDASSISAEISSDAFDRNPILNNANEAINLNSLYGNKHRFFVAGSKKFDYGAEKNGEPLFRYSVRGHPAIVLRMYMAAISIMMAPAPMILLYVPTDAEIDDDGFHPFD